jgi:hypothetical protein
MRESMFESLVGAAVIAVAGVFLWFAIDRGGEASAGPDRYELTARFNNISGIDRGADVRIAGVKAGVVKAIDGDPKRFEAVLTMSLDKKWALAGRYRRPHLDRWSARRGLCGPGTGRQLRQPAAGWNWRSQIHARQR